MKVFFFVSFLMKEWRVVTGQGGLVPVVDVPRRAHFKTIYCAYIFVMSVTLLLGAIVLIGMKYEL